MQMEQVLEWVFSGVLGLFGWLLRELWEHITAIRKDLSKLEKELPSSYVSKTDHAREFERLEKSIENLHTILIKVYDKLEQKADR
jgi:hypothetical protein